MSRAEFLDILRESLEGEIPQAELEENLRYYKEYFERDARSDEELCEELGDPRLIAKSVTEAYLASKGSEAAQYTGKARSEYSRMQNHGYSTGGTQSGGITQFLHKAAFWISVLLVIVVLAFVLRLALALVIPILVVVVLWKLIRGDW